MPRISIYSGEHQAMRLLIENYQLNYNALIKACTFPIDHNITHEPIKKKMAQ